MKNLKQQQLSIFEEITSLIALRQEGGYWDFKRQWHEKKADLLHDIICMANNLHNHAAYIIIGIDEGQNYAVVDVKSDPNRKNTQNIVDFLKDKKFARGIRPIVHVEHISLPSGDIDIIVIENSHNTPFFLTERFEGLCANHIYTRVMDTNTPKDKSADINNVEYLWRKRFRIDEMPIEKIEHYLETPDDWEPLQDRDSGFYYKYAPEYTIICDKDDRDGYEYYLFGQVDKRPSWWMITLKYHQTAIGQFLGIALDGGRSFVVAPDRAFDIYSTDMSCIGFYTGGLKQQLLEFYHRKETADEYSYRKYMEVVLSFNSESEHKAFVRYVQAKKARYDELDAQIADYQMPIFPDIKGYVMEHFKREYRDALIMQQMLTEFRMEKRELIMGDEINADT